MSGKDALVEFLKQQREHEEAQATVDWAKVRSEWIGALEDLFNRISGWLQSDALQTFLQVRREMASISEDHLGTYPVPVLWISAPAGRAVEITPRAKLIAGGRGRVDLISGPKKAILIWGEDGEWAFPSTYMPHRSAVPLSIDSFSEALRELLE